MDFTNKPHWVNAIQTKDERQGKYWLVRSLGGSSALAARMRDWLLTKIERFYGLPHYQKPKLRPDGRLNAPD